MATGRWRTGPADRGLRRRRRRRGAQLRDAPRRRRGAFTRVRGVHGELLQRGELLVHHDRPSHHHRRRFPTPQPAEAAAAVEVGWGFQKPFIQSSW
ncbi:Os12g0501900 [Oryza sativa Japonica Group]|uniref:Os12g0501900 protein n=1 Tax=Oryza sativa subsp. japonica TaxID=39947 RepID=C7JAB2_ORYSJ|nr:Os12g0501900 [Oryza sativa Japonica Group]|eukprot:NP_001176963.1 Os12g0501900 [Oryza sativa Japonica Group]